jgi:hypothetical protein
MNGSKAVEPGAALIALLKSSLSASGAQTFGHLVLYTSFGVVRGRTGLAFAQEVMIARENGEPDTASSPDVIALNDVTVEHYSNHLASAIFDRLYVKLSDVQGFALVGNQGQG